MLLTPPADLPPNPTQVSAYVRHHVGPKQGSERAKILAPLLRRSASKHQIPLGLLVQLIRVESNFNPREVSPAGALGLGQVMPLRSWANPSINLDLSCRVLKTYHTQVSHRYPGLLPQDLWHRTLVAYNMGFSRVSRSYNPIYRSRYSNLILRGLDLKAHLPPTTLPHSRACARYIEKTIKPTSNPHMQVTHLTCS